jgi:nicotinamidase-related amidase
MTISRNAVLLVVDVQQGFDAYNESLHRNNPELERNIARLLDRWRATGRPVVFVQHVSREPQSPLRPNQPGVEIKADVRPRPGEPVVQKSVKTNLCVSTTARMAGNLGFDTYVVSDATATFDNTGPDGRLFPAQLLHDVALADLNGEFATVLGTDTILESLEP